MRDNHLPPPLSEKETTKVFILSKPTLCNQKIVVRVIGRKILDVRDLHILQASSLSSEIDLGMSKAKVKFSNDFSLEALGSLHALTQSKA